MLVVAGLFAVGAAFLAWRLAQGPLDVTILVRIAESVGAAGDHPRLTVDRASVAWNGFNAGAGSGLELRLRDLHAADGSGRLGATVAQADVTLAPLPLLGGTIVPRRVVLDNVTVRIARDLGGDLQLDIGSSTPDADGDDLRDILAELRRPAGQADTEPTLRALEQVTVRRARLFVTEAASRLALEAEIDDLDLRRQQGGGIVGTATGRFELGAAAGAIALSAHLRPDGGTHVEATLAPLSTAPAAAAALARLDPALAGLGTLDTTLEAHLALDLSPALAPLAADLQLRAAAGTLAVPDSTPVAFDRASLAARATWDGRSWQPASVRLDGFDLVAVSAVGHRSTAHLDADATPAADRWTVRAALAVDHADFADLASLWPAAWGGHVRPWLTENVTAGTAHDASLSATLEVPTADPAHPRLTDLGGTLQAEGLVVHWLRPVPPVDRAMATLTVTGPDALVITVPRAQQGPLVLGGGVLRFTGLSQKDQYLALTANVAGSVPDLVRLLREKRLQLLDAHPLPITGSAGRVVGRLAVDVPLFDHLTFDQVGIGAKGRLTGLRLNGIVAGRDLSDADIGFDVSQDGLKASGPATLAGLPGQVDIAMDFRAGAPNEITERARFAARIGPADLAAHGIDATPVLRGGTALVDATYAERRNGAADVTVTADLADAALALGGWRKPAGAPSRAAATLSLIHGRLADIPLLQATGPDLDIAGRADVVDGNVRVLRVANATVGPTRLGGEIAFPADLAAPLRIRIAGPTLDLAGQLSRLSDSGGASGSGRDWVADLRVARVLLGGDRALLDLAVHAERLGGRLRSLQASTGGPEQLRASLAPAGTGRHLAVQAADTGALLRTLDVTGTIGGGRLSLEGDMDDRIADPPLQGRLQLAQFGVREGVILGKLLQAVTIYGVVDAMRAQGVYFADAVVPFSLGKSLLRIGPARAASPSLGLTAQGTVDLSRNILDLSGTVVPAYVLNAALGRLPLVGHLFSAERDGGLFAADFAITGPAADPAVSVNPLSLLTPGILRRVFGMFR